MTAATFWLCLTITALVWYSIITIYVSIKGVADIKHMLRRLKERSGHDEGATAQRDSTPDAHG
jgi:hypothetical protein